jgi:rRNA-processing protein FCF1
MLDAAGLIEKHRSKGVLVDTNLLVLYLVGKVNRNRIRESKRTEAYTIEDFDLLEKLISWLGGLVSTPHVLAQVSDLTDLKGKESTAARGQFRNLVEEVEERQEAGRTIVADQCFERLGFTDAAIATLCRNNVLVLTADFDLWDTLTRRGIEVVNFHHIRTSAWKW